MREHSLVKSSTLILVILLMAISLLTACSVTGDKSVERVTSAGKLKVGFDPTYPPMEYVAEDNKTFVGFDVDLAGELAKRLGVEVELVPMDWDGILSGLKGKRYDVIISSMNITEERLKEVNFIEYAQMSQVFVSRKGLNVATEKDLAGKVVVVQAETTSHIWADELKAGTVPDIKEIRSFPAATTAFLEVKNGRGDVIVIDEPVGLYYAALDPDTFVVTGRAMEPEAIGIAIRKADKLLAEALTKALADMRSDGSYMALSQQWFGGELGK